ncbi:MAG: proton-coupled thiamine transporter YuaJ [Ruminococcaceae bacterium]|nr:proton-coupled thiamine transporter YuaJ [Oscillospiraceae bacterium]
MRTKTPKLVLAAILVALAIALSFAKLWEMPLGGSVTLGSMLPIMLLSLALGVKWGLAGSCVFALFQIAQALIEGNVFPYCETGATLVICVLFDYIFPFIVLGLAGAPRRLRLGKFRHAGAYLGIVLVCVLRFLSHFVTGVAIWGQWAPDGMGKYLYSLLYNGGYMLPELGITLVCAALLLESPEMRRLINLEVDRDRTVL